MNILLINPPSVASEGRLIPPIGLLSLASFLNKNSQLNCKLIDLNIIYSETASIDCCYKFLRERMFDLNPNVIGFTTLCNSYPLVLEYAKKLKYEFNPIVVLGGVQATLTAKPTMERFKWIDVIVKHEGEFSFNEYIDALIHKKDLNGVNGIVYRDNNLVIETHWRNLISNLNDLPEINYKLLDIARYCKKDGSFFIPVEVGRGCPFSCAFCSASVMWQCTCRMKSPERIAQEMDKLKTNFGFEYFELVQDNFTTKAHFVKNFCRELKNRNYHWKCFSRCDSVSDDLIQVMKESGCEQIFYGVETGSEIIQKKLGKNLKLQNKERTIAITINNGVDFTTSYMIGHPDESLNDIRETLDHALFDATIGAKRVLISILTPLPKTRIFDLYKDALFEPLSYDNEVSPLKHVSEEMKDQVKKYKDIFTSFYFIRHPTLELKYLVGLKNFALFLIDNYPKTFFMFTQIQNTNLADLFKKYYGSNQSIHEIIADILKNVIYENDKNIIYSLYQYEKIIQKMKTSVSDEDDTHRTSCNNFWENTSLFVAQNFQVKHFPFKISQLIKKGTLPNYRNVQISEDSPELLLFVSMNDEVVSYKIDDDLLNVLRTFESPVYFNMAISDIEAKHRISKQKATLIVDNLINYKIIRRYQGGLL